MSFGYPGQQQYGTSGGSGTIPDAGDYARAEGRVYQAFLILNGPQTIRDREAVESVIRVIGETGGSLVAIVALENGGVVDSNVTQMDFGAGVVAAQVSPGVVLITVSGIATAMITDGAVTEAKILDLAVTTNKLADNAVTNSKIANAQVTTAKIANNAVTGGAVGKLANGTIEPTNVNIASLTACPTQFYDFRDTIASGRSGVNSTVGETKLSVAVTLPNDGKKYRMFARAFAKLEFGTAGNIAVAIEMADGSTSAFRGQKTADGTDAGTAEFVEMHDPQLYTGDGSVKTVKLLVKVNAGNGFFHGGTLTVNLVPHWLG